MLPGPTAIVDKALSDTRESRQVDFKQQLDVRSTEEWCEIVKDIVAMANSGGGAIVIGLDDFGKPTRCDPAPLLAQDPALLIDRLARFTGEQFDEVEILDRRKGRKRVAVIHVGPRFGAPLIFEKEGSYKGRDGKDKCAFAKGSVYFRHGAKSEPGLSRDLQRFAKLEENRVKRELLKNISKVSLAPRGSEVLIVDQDGAKHVGSRGVRVVDDPNAPIVGVVYQDQTHPFLLGELLRNLNKQLEVPVNSHDLQCIRKVYGIEKKLAYFHKPLHGSPQYSAAYVEWLVDQRKKDPQFFIKARKKMKN
jgi:hypothetical protein